MLREPKNLTESLFPLVSMNAFIGHGIFRFPAHKSRLVFSVIWTVVCTSLYLALLHYTLDSIFNESWYSDDERVALIVIFANVGILIIGIIVSWRNAKKFGRILHELTKVDETLQELGSTFNYARTRNVGYGLIFMWIVIIIVLDSVDTVWYSEVVSLSRSCLYVIVFHHPVHVNSIVAFNFCVGVWLVGARYKKANAILESLKNPVQPIKMNWQNSRNKTTYQSAFTILSPRTRQDLRTTRKYLIQIIKHLDRELWKIGKDLDNAYGIQLAFEITALFVLFTAFIYELYNLVITPLGYSRARRITVLAMWVCVYFIKLILINESCEAVCSEARRTGAIIHSLDENLEDSELANEIHQFSLQLMLEPVSFSPVGLVTLGHKFVRSFLATVTTYLVILIQMRPFNPNS